MACAGYGTETFKVCVLLQLAVIIECLNVVTAFRTLSSPFQVESVHFDRGKRDSTIFLRYL